MTHRQFFYLAGLAAIGGALIVVVALARRSNGGWLRGQQCEKVQWDTAQLPAPVFVTPGAEPWMEDLRAGLALVDPAGHWLHLAGSPPEGVAAPAGAVVVDLLAQDEHGHAYIDDRAVSKVPLTPADTTLRCWIATVRVSMPSQVPRGSVRVRAIAHEFGHVLGLAHSDVETSLMYPKAAPLFEARLSDEDRARLVGAYGGE